MGHDLRFDGRVAVVTGAGGRPGLGRSYARLLASRGARVVINDVGARAGLKGCSDNAAADVVAGEIRAAGGEAVSNANDISTPQGADDLVATTIERFGRLDILVNSAGVCIYADVDEMSDDDVRATIDANLMTAIWMCRAAWPHMRDANYGRIVNTTSGAIFGLGKLSAYSAAKAGVIGFTRVLATEARDLDMRCNVIAPAAGTRMTAVALREGSDALKRMDSFSPDHVAPVVGWLCHHDCSVTGETVSRVGAAVTRVSFCETAGIVDDDISIETVHCRLDEILDSGIELRAIPDDEESAAIVAGAKPYHSERRVEAPR